MESLNKMTETLEMMLDAHLKLLELVKQKRELLVDGSAAGLQNLIYQETVCADEIQKLEQQRQQIVKEYMAEQGITGDAFTLDEVINTQKGGSNKAALTNLAKILRGVIDEISLMNETNQQLLQTSLSYIQYTIGLHVQKEPEFGYGPKSGKRYSNLLDAKI
ncbi:flagellar protein FlgN [Neobacillus jeddahensis]|uniref:flagellar protein FlgN n=1 Tax=Neobacillus jeddahensis TaxID=1461580 RepID=UPI00058BB550|nr:flagellar protein FlgN [Neobacillus jeddahensis]